MSICKMIWNLWKKDAMTMQAVIFLFVTSDPNLVCIKCIYFTLQREHSVTCGLDSFAADPSKQTTVSVSYLLTE